MERKKKILNNKIDSVAPNWYCWRFDENGFYYIVEADDKKHRVSLPEADAFLKACNYWKSIKNNPPQKP